MPEKARSRRKQKPAPASGRTDADSAVSPPPSVAPGCVVSKPGPEIEVVLSVLGALATDLGTEPSTALLLYTLLQTPGVKAHNLLCELPDDVRARVTLLSLVEAQSERNGISIQHVRYASERIASDVCGEPEVDSRHLLMTCLVGSGLLGNGPELGIPDTDSKFILGRSNTAVRALRDSGLDPLEFLEKVRNIRPSVFVGPPFFFILCPQGDRTRVLRVEDMGEFAHGSGRGLQYPARLGLLDPSISRGLDALMEFEALLNESRTPESEFQDFFERNPEFLLSDDHVAVHPGVLLSGSAEFGLKPDFFLQRRDVPLWDIAELKLPLEKLVRGIPARRGLAAAVRSGMDQLRTYREYFNDSVLAARFRGEFGLDIYHPRLTLVIGRDVSFGSYYERQRLSPPEVRLLTYDDLVRMAKHRALVLPFLKKLPKGSI